MEDTAVNEYFKKQIDFYKNKKGYTIKKIAELAGLPESTLSKIFAGINKNPTLDTIRKIAKVLDCSFDDLMTQNEAESEYYFNNQTGKLAQEIHDNPNLRVLFDASRDLKPEDINAVISIIERIKDTKRD